MMIRYLTLDSEVATILTSSIQISLEFQGWTDQSIAYPCELNHLLKLCLV